MEAVTKYTEAQKQVNAAKAALYEALENYYDNLNKVLSMDIPEVLITARQEEMKKIEMMAIQLECETKMLMKQVNGAKCSMC